MSQRYSRVWFAIGLIAIISMRALPAQAEGLLEAKLSGDRKAINERYDPEVKVSGSVVVGVMSAAAVTQLAQGRILIQPPERHAGESVCLRVTSRDGVYSSKNEYEIPREGLPARIALPYISKHQNVLGAFKRDDVAITTSVGKCDSRDSIYVEAGSFIDRGSSEAANAIVYINSFEATEVFWMFARKNDEVVERRECEEITQGRRTTFDFFCVVPRNDLNESVSIKIERERFGRPQPVIDLRILGTAE